MAEKTKSCQDGGLMLTDTWKLFPLDARNWELCELRDGKWQRRGKYYSYNTVHNAIAYVADERLKARCVDEAMALREIAEELRALYGSMVARVEAAMRRG